jgi:uncharacterized SAM-dependent methyltransferase
VDGRELNRQFVRHLEHKPACQPDLYLGDCGRNWLRFETSDEAAISHNLTDLLIDSIRSLTQSVRDHHLLNIGPADCDKAELILRHMPQSDLRQFICVDVNETDLQTMTDLTLKLNIHALYVVAMLRHLRQVRKFCNGPALFTMLGNQICQYDPCELLPFIHQTMTDQDLLLFDCALLTADLQKKAVTSTGLRRKGFHIPHLASKGIRSQDYEIEHKLVRRRIEDMYIYRVDKHIVFRNDCGIALDPDHIHYKNNDTIHMGFVFKYQAWQLMQLLSSRGFDILQTHFDHSRNHLMVLAKRLTD